MEDIEIITKFAELSAFLKEIAPSLYDDEKSEKAIYYAGWVQAFSDVAKAAQ